MQIKMKSALKALIACSVILVMGCQTVPEQKAPEVKIAKGSNEMAAGGIRYDTDDARVAKLWSTAEEARENGNTDMALQRLFEALEIQPKNSLLWSRAAEIELNNQQSALAENFAVKSNSFAANNESLLHRNWLIIEHARSMRGDLLGVRSAHKKVQEYQNR